MIEWRYTGKEMYEAQIGPVLVQLATHYAMPELWLCTRVDIGTQPLRAKNLEDAKQETELLVRKYAEDILKAFE
jgi:hypothetical protein